MNKQGNGDSKRQHKWNVNSGVRNYVTAEDCYKKIAEAAYYISEQRGFTPGHELDDWLHAEAEVKKSLQETFQ